MRHARWFLILLIWLPSCTYFSGDTTVLITSTPAGAEIYVDGQPTGDTTPCLIDMNPYGGSNHQVSLRKAGFDTEEREVFHYTTGYTSRWIDGADEKVLSFPLWWTLGDTLTPFAVKWQYVPHEVHAKMYVAGQAPVSVSMDEEAKAQQRQASSQEASSEKVSAESPEPEPAKQEPASQAKPSNQ